jgi:hypothetical protein
LEKFFLKAREDFINKVMRLYVPCINDFFFLIVLQMQQAEDELSRMKNAQLEVVNVKETCHQLQKEIQVRRMK